MEIPLKMEPMIPAFNDACNYIASRIFPLGFDICRGAPNTMLELNIALNIHQRQAIWDGDHEETCFANTETWRQFRAWHDWVHYRFDCAFTLAGEHKALHIQAGQLMRLYGRGPDVVDMIALMFCNIIGPLENKLVPGYQAVTGREFCEANMKHWLAYAQNIVDTQGITDVDAIQCAESAYDFRSRFGPEVPREALPQ